MPKLKRGRRPVKRCLSCKRLKIKCDQKQPCEYCKHRGKECIYEAEIVVETELPRSPEPQQHEPPRQDLASDLTLTQMTSQLSMTQQDLEVLTFFEQKAKSMIFYNNLVFDDAFKTEVNPLYQRNATVRYTLLACSAIIQLNFLLNQNHDGALIKSEQLHQAGLDYFQSAIAFQQDLVKLVERDENVHEDAIKELLSACLLQAGYFVTNVGRVMPLLCLDGTQIDLITLLRAHKVIREKYLPRVANSKMKYLHPSGSAVPDSIDDEYYITSSLRKNLNVVYGSEASAVKGALEEMISAIEQSMYRTMEHGFPYPMIATVVHLSDDYKYYLYQANDFALRLLFVYAVLAAMSKFCTRRYDNMFLDYVIWYKNRKFDTVGKFEYLMDEKLYFLVAETDFEPDFDHIRDFNPIEAAKKYENPEATSQG
ncbi:hypothetical protein Cantr_09891 [Candida viswanathii]|uniref:Zn(2)-C6 fungal-type domain-containing protein n=1 Tax=Candida viswanathii TaxID=5486 RepID=A0A367YAS5_9ASCO|nr:hypothetical protein Cantr_09891 [Candida viswanathii]